MYVLHVMNAIGFCNTAAFNVGHALFGTWDEGGEFDGLEQCILTM